MEKKKYTIDDLGKLTGYSRRTIRYYVQEGLLAPPAGRGRGGFYFDSHLQKLLEIKSIKDRGIKLSAIQEVLKKNKKPELLNLKEVWIRHPIKPGLEIHVSRNLEEKEREKIKGIIRAARSILDSGGENDG